MSPISIPLVMAAFPTGIPEVLMHPFADPWPLAVILWLGLVTTAFVRILETNALQEVSATGEIERKRQCQYE